jgi:hypothetical protein
MKKAHESQKRNSKINAGSQARKAASVNAPVETESVLDDPAELGEFLEAHDAYDWKDVAKAAHICFLAQSEPGSADWLYEMGRKIVANGFKPINRKGPEPVDAAAQMEIYQAFIKLEQLSLKAAALLCSMSDKLETMSRADKDNAVFSMEANGLATLVNEVALPLVEAQEKVFKVTRPFLPPGCE